MSAGLIVANMTVLLFPPKAFISNRVKTESLYGTLTFFPWAFSANAWMQFPTHESDWLIDAPSFRRSPVACVDESRSLNTLN